MRVAVIFTFDYSLKTWESSGTLQKELKPYQILNQKYGVNFTFITYGNSSDKNIDTKINGIKIIPIYEKFNKSSNKFINYIKSFVFPIYLSSNLKDIDIIKQNQLLGSWVSIILKFLINKPLITRTGYDMYEFSILEMKKYYIKFLYKYLTKFTLKFSNLYTVSSKSDYKFLKENFKKTQISIRPNWVSLDGFFEFDKRPKNKILSVGRLEKQKNYKYLIKSFKDSSFSIDLIGEGSEKDSLKLLSKKYNVDVNFLDRVSNEKILTILPNYRYFITPSLYEGNPKTVLEALSRGCVVFASNIKNHKEIIDHGKNGFLFDLDKDNLFSVFQKEISNSENIEFISLKGFENIKKTNSIDICVKREYLDFKKLLN